MLNITYAPNDADTAERMQEDLATANLKMVNHILLALITPDALADEGVQKAIRMAQKENHRVALVILRKTELPKSLQEFPSLNLTSGYNMKRLTRFVLRADLEAQVRRANNRVLFYLVAAVIIVFAGSIWALTTGIVASPTDEFATENALIDSQVETITFPTLDAFQPRTTQDAESFPATADALREDNEDIYPFLIGTATALPANQNATQSAIATSAVQTQSARDAESTPEAEGE